MRPQPIMIGARYGRWTVLEQAPSAARGRYFLCRCDCGNIREVKASPGLALGRSLSCGCVRRAQLITMATTHGQHLRQEYRVWKAMIQRCHNPDHPSYKNHGARGITVCQRWRTSLHDFMADMGAVPSPAHTLERVDNDAGYSPENCIWATRRVNQRNRRTNRYLTHNGETLTLSAWAERLGMSPEGVARRIDVYGWPIERAVTVPRLSQAKAKNQLPKSRHRY